MIFVFIKGNTGKNPALFWSQTESIIKFKF